MISKWWWWWWWWGALTAPNACSDHVSSVCVDRFLRHVCVCLVTSSWARKMCWLISSSAAHLSWKIRFNLGCRCLNYTELPQGVFRSVCVLVKSEWLRGCLWSPVRRCVGFFAQLCVFVFCACASVRVRSSAGSQGQDHLLLVFVSLKDKGTLCCWSSSDEQQQTGSEGWWEEGASFFTNTDDLIHPPWKINDWSGHKEEERQGQNNITFPAFYKSQHVIFSWWLISQIRTERVNGANPSVNLSDCTSVTNWKALNQARVRKCANVHSFSGL